MALTKIGTDGVKNDAVTEPKIADDAITGAQLADNCITSSNVSGIFQNAVINTSHILNNAVTTNEIADESVTLAKLPHGTSSNDGKFLRANNGADPSFETVTGTTINNNADNRVITGSGTAGTLEGESGLIFDGTNLGIGTSDPSGESINGSQNLVIMDTTSDGGMNIKTGTGGNAQIHFSDTGANGQGRLIYAHANDSMQVYTSGSERMRIDSSGNVNIGIASQFDSNKVNMLGTKAYSSGIPQQQLNVADAQAYSTTDNGGSIGFSAKYNSGGAYTTMASIEGVKHNNIDGNYQGALTFKTRNNNGDNIIRMRLTDNGLCFGTDTAGANALDDYEEGDWTPDDLSGSAYNVASGAVGKYVKIGAVVHAWAQFGTDASGNVAVGDRILIGDLPFNANGINNPAATVTINYTSSTYSTAKAHVTSSNEIAFTITQTTGHARHGAGYYVQVTYRTDS